MRNQNFLSHLYLMLGIEYVSPFIPFQHVTREKNLKRDSVYYVNIYSTKCDLVTCYYSKVSPKIQQIYLKV